MKTIDDATPEEWNSLRKGWTSKEGVKWPTLPLDNAPNEHPVFAEAAMRSSYDPVNSPAHYNNGNVECIDAIEAMLTREQFIGYLRGNSFKYNWRMDYKGKQLQDLKKAQWYSNKLLELIEGTNNDS